MKGLLEFLSMFDWITPTVGFIQDVANDPTLTQGNSWTFFVPYDQSLTSGFNARGIRRLMSQKGIKTWGEQLTDGEYFFSVKLEQARWAEYILLGAGVPLTELSMNAPAPKRIS